MYVCVRTCECIESVSVCACDCACASLANWSG